MQRSNDNNQDGIGRNWSRDSPKANSNEWNKAQHPLNNLKQGNETRRGWYSENQVKNYVQPETRAEERSAWRAPLREKMERKLQKCERTLQQSEGARLARQSFMKE